MAQLQLGQIIKVQVLENLGNSQYLISYKNLQLTAVSEVDLFAKSVWLKVTQKTPYPKLQIIIEENSSRINELLEYADKNNLIIPRIPKPISDFLTFYKGEINPHDLYDFINWYIEKLSWGVFTGFNYLFLANKGITFRELMSVYDCHYVYKNKDNQITTDMIVKLVATKSDLEGVDIDANLSEKIDKTLPIIENINQLFKDHSFQLSLLYIKHKSFVIIVPVEYLKNEVFEIIAGILKTKHFGKISFKYEKQDSKSEIFVYFESLLFLNSLKNELQNCLQGRKITLTLNIQNIGFFNNSLHKDWG